MLKYPVFISARHEDGRLEQFNLKVIAVSPKDAMDKAFKQCQPRYAGQDGWQIGMAVDELMATEPDEESDEST